MNLSSGSGKLLSIIFDTDSTTPTNAIISAAIGTRNYYLVHYKYSTG
jgi:hypothetical protein